MFSLSQECKLCYLIDGPISGFDCGNTDLTDFFCNDAVKYQNQLLGQTLFFRLKISDKIVCAFTLSNDSIKVGDLPNNRRRKIHKNIPHIKNKKSYPATLIGRFGVSVDFRKQHVGSAVMDFIKSICVTEDVHKCRFLIVDAYNTEEAIRFYTSNDFAFVFSTEEQEKEYYEKNKNKELKEDEHESDEEDKELKTRFMYYDLLPWVEKLTEQ